MQLYKPVIEQPMAHIRHLTQPILDALATMRGVVGIVCFGSYALGTADRHSDVDLLVLCHPSVMPVGTRQAILATLPATRCYHGQAGEMGWEEPWAAVADEVVLEAVTVDIVYQTRAWLTDVVEQVVTTGALSTSSMPFRPYTMLGLLDIGVVLYDPAGVIAGLRRRLRPYPAVLQANIVRAYEPLMMAGVAALHDYARRDIGPGAFLFHLVRVMDAMSGLLYAVNECYDPATKRGEIALGQLPLLPEDGVRRLTGLLEGPFDAGGRRRVVAALATLVADVQRLIVSETTSQRLGGRPRQALARLPRRLKTSVRRPR